MIYMKKNWSCMHVFNMLFYGQLVASSGLKNNSRLKHQGGYSVYYQQRFKLWKICTLESRVSIYISNIYYV